MAGKRERFFFLVIGLLALVAIVVIALKADELGWSDETSAPVLAAAQPWAAAFFSFL